MIFGRAWEPAKLCFTHLWTDATLLPPYGRYNQQQVWFALFPCAFAHTRTTWEGMGCAPTVALVGMIQTVPDVASWRR